MSEKLFLARMILFLGMLMPAEPALVLIVILESLYVDLPSVHDIALFFLQTLKL